MPRLIRRQPLRERILSTLNPMDFLLWLSEELETRDWDSAAVGTQLGLGLNFVFLLARANSGASSSNDDLFSDDQGSGWSSLFVYPIVWSLVAFSLLNASYTATRTRKYRLFEANVEVQPSTPSAKRVKVDTISPQSSPMRFLANIITPDTPESRAHPDKASDVWELSVWDPLPASLRLFCLFGPANVLVYMIFLPLAPLDPRPSVTVFNTLLLQIIISAPLLGLCTLFAQQAKDTAIIQKEVMHEYNTKFVHPRLHPVVRDVGTQHCEEQPKAMREFVQIGTPTTQIRRTFHAHANPYTRSTEAPQERGSTPTNVMKPQMFTPPTASRRPNPFIPSASQRPSSLRKSLPAAYSTSATSMTNAGTSSSGYDFGGSMGIHSHRQSPLKKATSLNDINARETASPRNSREMAAYEQRNWGQGTPSKQTQKPRHRPSSPGASSNPFAGMGRNNAQQERYPSRW